MKVLYTALVTSMAIATMSAAIARDNYVDSQTIRQVQQTLHSRGFQPGGIDGLMGPRTQVALKKFQQSENLETTGQLNRQTLAALGISMDPDARADSGVYSAATIGRVQHTLNQRGFQAGAVDGVMSASTHAAIREFQKSENLEATGRLNRQTLAALGVEPQPGPSARVAAGYGSATIRDVQRALNQRGFRAGPVDGVMGPSTQGALRDFQQSENLEPTGRLNRQTLSALGIPSTPLASVR